MATQPPEEIQATDQGGQKPRRKLVGVNNNSGQVVGNAQQQASGKGSNDQLSPYGLLAQNTGQVGCDKAHKTQRTDHHRRRSGQQRRQQKQQQTDFRYRQAQ